MISEVNRKISELEAENDRLREELAFMLEWAEGIMWDRLDFTEEEIASRFPGARAILETPSHRTALSDNTLTLD